jgi:hypothetical protein
MMGYNWRKANHFTSFGFQVMYDMSSMQLG